MTLAPVSSFSGTSYSVLIVTKDLFLTIFAKLMNVTDIQSKQWTDRQTDRIMTILALGYTSFATNRASA